MANLGDRNVLGMRDLDVRVWRTVPMDRFLAMLVTKEDTLSNPGTWDDKYESPVLHRSVVRLGTGELADFLEIAKRWFAQCWCKVDESDAMWRIYSPDKRGVRVGSTVRKAFENMVANVPGTDPDRECFVGEVGYLDEGALRAALNRLTFTDLRLRDQNDGFAETLLAKRTAFAHEEEVRLMYDDGRSRTPGTEGAYLPFGLDPNAVFEPEVTLDPRLKPHEFAGHEAVIKALGWRGAVRRSTLYDVPGFGIAE